MRRPVLAALAVVLSLGACASRADDLSLGPTSTSTTTPSDATTTTSVPGACRADDLDPNELEPLLLDERGGFTLQADDVDDTGPSDLAKAIHDDEQPDAAVVLTDLGFRRGYQRFWANPAGHALIVFVYEFCDAEAATAYGDRVIEYLPSLEPFEVVGTPGSRGISGTPDGHVVAYAAATVDAVLVLAIATGSEDTLPLNDVRDRSTSLLADQVEALRAS